MNEITISITYDKQERRWPTNQISEMKSAHVPEGMTVDYIEWDGNWTANKSRVTFRGEKNDPTI